MEIIRKKISLECFKSRIPALVETIHNNNDSKDGSWGEIPKPIVILGKELKYGTIMDLYYKLLDIIKTTTYYEYDMSGKKWLLIDYDWRNVFDREYSITFLTELPTQFLEDRMIVGITDAENIDIYTNEVNRVFDDTIKGLDVIDAVNEIIGRIIVPAKYDGIYVPYFIFKTDIPDLLAFMDNLLEVSEKVCCEKKRYIDYGGTEFHEYLKKMNEYDYSITRNPLGSMTTIDLPILLTSRIYDLGQFKTYNVDEIFIDDETSEVSLSTETNDVCKVCGYPFNKKFNHDSCTAKVVKTKGESKLLTLRKKRVSVDDLGNLLPGIYNPNKETIDSPYQIGYIKNIQTYNDIFYGDTIVDMIETCDTIEVTEAQYEAIKQLCTETQYEEGTDTYPIDDTILQLTNSIIQYGNLNYTLDDINKFVENDTTLRISEIKNKLAKYYQKKYPQIYCLKQNYTFTYELTIGIEDGYIEDSESGSIKPNIIEHTFTQIVKGTIHMGFDNPSVTITYVLGGTLSKNENKLILDEVSPFNLSEDEENTWDGSGVWYCEAFPLKKNNVLTCTLGDIEKTFIYDEIDFESKETTLSFPGIDFPRKKYILCEDVRYKSDAYHKNTTCDPVFRDEKMLGLSFPLKEKYNVEINRGMSSAFERHLQLSEIKSWQDLENYRNGSLLNN